MPNVVAGIIASRRWVSRILLLVLISVILPAYAQDTDNPATPCDPNYMDAMEARAYLEAQREISQNQNLILKPDSVLQYTCFDQFLGYISNDGSWSPADGPFSDSEYWGDVPHQGEGTLNGVLTNLVEQVVDVYLNNNFDNTYLGGRTEDSYETTMADEYSCEQMDKVWLDAQCLNFFDNPTDDAFYDFPWYENNDPRQQPQAGVCEEPDTVGDAIPVAFNDNQKLYTLDPDNKWPNGGGDKYDEDPVNTHYDLIMPNGTKTSNDTVNCEDVDPIPTGVCVIRAGWSTEYQDAVCPNPGCHYVAPGNSENNVPDGTGCPGDIGTCG